MKKRITWQGCCILFSAAIAVAPVIQAAGEESIHLAKAIGEDTSQPTAAPDKDAPPKPADPLAEKTPEAATDSQPLSPAAKIGLAIAGLLVLAGGGGGGGGGSSAPPHP